ncbi:Kinesin-like_protein [Hexamita inflata]|uniref:Kinesin-like protein n=1 Tax=Hexamita inflata TaxID=28002 RepID=A0AA86PMS6_9EUKA|nr:Kinesin-like protein [Hexamita inflata]
MSDDNVRVIVRCRPFNKREAGQGDYNIIFQDKELGQVTIERPETKDMNGKVLDTKTRQTYTFDGSYGQTSTQIEVFDESVKPMIDFTLQGYNSTVFAYGQTGSGKTHTMMGYAGDRGMIPLGIQLIFDRISQAASNETYLVRCSFYEIYNEQIRDLMTNTLNIPLKETKDKGVFIEGLSEYRVNSEKEIDDLMVAGNKNRTVGETKMNATSSRSHSIFQVIVECATDTGEKDHIRAGKLNLVDLAGSERAEKTGATGDRLKEGAKINLSLSCLGQVIQKLVDGDEFVPYRQSKLTHILKDSLGGNAKTLMVVALSPASTNFEETSSSLRYADRAKRIKNKAKINEDPKDAQIREMRDTIEKLEAQLAMYLGVGGGQPLTAQQEAQQLESIQNIQQQLVTMQKYTKKVVKTKKSPQEIAKEEASKQMLEDELKKKEDKANKANKFVEEMQNKLEEQKKALLDKEKLENEAQELERQERAARQELAEQKQAQMLLKRQLAEAEEKKKGEEETYANMQEEREVLKRKLEKYKDKEIQTRQEYEDIRRDLAKDLQIRQQDIDDLQKYDDMKQIILDYYVPKDVQDKLKALAKYDEQAEKFTIAGSDLIGNRKRGFI